VNSSVAITLEAGGVARREPIYRFGTEQQRRRYLPELCAGTSEVQWMLIARELGLG
jgi:alkylation response protein AidB-like acyl-CoA dehydrogenase